MGVHALLCLLSTFAGRSCSKRFRADCPRGGTAKIIPEVQVQADLVS